MAGYLKGGFSLLAAQRVALWGGGLGDAGTEDSALCVLAGAAVHRLPGGWV